MPQFKVGDRVKGTQRLGSQTPPYKMNYCPYVGEIIGKDPQMGWKIRLISREVKPLIEDGRENTTCEHDWNLKPAVD